MEFINSCVNNNFEFSLLNLFGLMKCNFDWGRTNGNSQFIVF